MVKRNKTKGQTPSYKKLHRKLKIDQELRRKIEIKKRSNLMRNEII